MNVYQAPDCDSGSGPDAQPLPQPRGSHPVSSSHGTEALGESLGSLDAAADAIVMIDAQGRICFWNEGAGVMFGYSPEEAVGQEPHALLAPARYRAACQFGWKQFQKSGRGPVVGRPIEWTACRKDGQEFPVEMTVTPILQESQWQALSIIRDLTHRKRAEEALLESQERFAKAFRSSPAPMVISETTTGKFIDVNDRWLGLLGYTREEMLGQTSLDLGIWADPTLRERMVAELRVKWSFREVPARFFTRSGEVRSTLWSAERITISGADAMLSLFYDCTEREKAEAEQRQLQAQLIQAHKMEAIGQLAGGVAHDFNNILTAILMHLSLLQMDQSLPTHVRIGLKDLDLEAHRAATLTRQLLLFSRQEMMRPQLFEMNSLLVNLLKMLRRLIGEQIQLDLQDAPEELWVKADPGMVEQVVMNLVVNARDAMPLGGCVALHTKRVDFDAAPVAANPDRRCGRFVCLAVSDTGCGMDASTQQRIFEPFFTTKEAGKGTGLGLATVYSIAKQHQGWIEVESTLDRGTTFSIFLPAESKPVAKEGQSTQKSSLTGGGETLLLVEDEDYVRASERRILSELGYQVLEAGSVSVAKQIWEANQDRIALLITDMILPEGSTGLDLIEDLFKRTPTLKAILVSGYCAESSQARVAPSGRVRFLAKPLAARRLARAVRDLLGQESASIDAPA